MALPLSCTAAAARHDQDPCTLLTANEAAHYVGTLVTPPYRADDPDGTPNPAGEECRYRGSEAREIDIQPSWHGARMASRVLDLPQVVGKALNAGAPGMDSLAGRIAQSDSSGPWDHATWMPLGVLFVTKGDAMVRVDVSGASGQKADALALARLVAPRIGHPLDYDGAHAVALAPKPVQRPATACDLVPRSDVEAAIGPLDGAPTPDSSGSGCTYHVSTAEGMRAYPVEFVWQGGQKNYTMLKHSMSMVSGVMGLPSNIGAGLDSVKGGGNMGQMIGGLMKMVTGAPRTTATGAVTTEGLRTDTTLQGPWDNASLLHGTQLIAVRHDVFVGMDLQSADYAKAKALMAAICGRL